MEEAEPKINKKAQTTVPVLIFEDYNFEVVSDFAPILQNHAGRPVFIGTSLDIRIFNSAEWTIPQKSCCRF